MLHKYLRSRLAPGARRRKRHRERGYASQNRACGSSGCSSPIIIPGDPQEICQLTAAAFRFQRPAMRESVVLSRRTQASKTHALQSPAPLREQPQAGSASPPSPGNAHRTCPGNSLGPKLGSGLRDLGWSEHASLPWGLGPTLPSAGTRARPQITLLLSASSRPWRPGREPAASPHRPWQSGRAATLPPTCLQVHYPTHKQPLPTRHHLPALRIPEAVLPPPTPTGNHKVSRE